MSEQEQSSKNYEMLIRIDEQQKFVNKGMMDLHKDIAVFRSDFSKEIERKADVSTVADHETRIRRLEKWVWMAIGILTFLEAAVTIYVSIHAK